MESTSLPPTATGTTGAGWFQDPYGRYEFRYWDGQQWTHHVSQDGGQAIDDPNGQPVQPMWEGPQPPATTTAPVDDLAVPHLGARNKALELAQQVRALREERTSLLGERERLSALGALGVVELEDRSRQLQAQVADQESLLAQQRVSAVQEIEQWKATAAQQLQGELAGLVAERDRLAARVSELQAEVVDTEELAILQEVGVYEYRHPLSDAVAFQAERKRVQDGIKPMANRDGGAVLAATDWTVNGSAAQGRKMVREYSKLVLRAYNAEADNLVRGLKPYKLDTSVERLDKVTHTIERLGEMMNIRISLEYHSLRIKELELTADYLEKKAEEKEREREEKARLKEERQAQLEIERERERLEKEQQLKANARDALRAKGDEEGAARVEAQLAEVQAKIEHVDFRAANIRTGHVYVISNPGSFGHEVVKIGMTRRLDPHVRVTELGDASVPFRFDVHVMLYSEDAVSLEANLHQRLAERRINLVNRRREFFRATPQEVKDHLLELEAEVLEYSDVAEAAEWRQSETTRGELLRST